MRSDTGVFSANLVKACRSKDAQRDRAEPVATQAEVRAVRVLHPAPLAAGDRPPVPVDAVANRSIGFQARRQSNRVVPSACCFDHPAWPT